MPNLAILGIGPKKQDQPEPPAFGGPPDAAPDTADDGAGGDLTPDMLDYHGADMTCGSCSHFTAPSTCDRWPDPVEDGGWCKGWQDGGAEAETPTEDMAPGEEPEAPVAP